MLAGPIGLVLTMSGSSASVSLGYSGYFSSMILGEFIFSGKKVRRWTSGSGLALKLRALRVEAEAIRRDSI